MLRLIRRPRYVLVTALLVVSLLGGYGLLRQRAQTNPPTVEPAKPQGSLLTTFSENGVGVEIGLEQPPSEPAWLVGTFTPLQDHFHLYSQDLPRAGLRGQGRPTLLEIISPSGVEPLGPVQVDQPTHGHYLPALGQAISVYPDGPVTLRLPVKLPTNSGGAPTELSVTYMACSDESCMPPVMDKRISVVIPDPTER